jgi:enoyl-CoA hydratase/carnithine racemase
MDDSLLLREDRDGVARLTLNRPKQRNALSRALMAALHEALDAIEADRSVRVAVLAGAGPGFCAGHDLRELQALGREGHAAVFAQCSALMQRIVSLRVPVIARVHGIATAAGCQLVATCDLALAGRSARFATPGVNIGLFCSTPMVALSRAVGRKAAMEMLLTGEMIDAGTAERLGLVNHAVEDEALDAAVDALAARIASRSPASVAYGKPAFYRQAEMPLASAYDFAAEVMVRNMQAADAAEGIGAFIEKREPVWILD